jgi:predicted ribosomally synthesized peptide with SipW-like signal peptide
MKKLMIALMAVLITVALVGIGTYAYFSDTETSNGNTFAAGTLDLTVDDQDDPNVVSLTIGDIAPGWSERYSWVLKNVGTIDGQPSLEFGTITNNENTVTEPEVGATGENGGEPGELGGVLRMNVYWSQDGGATWNYISSITYCGDAILNTYDGKVIGLGLLSGCRTDVKLPVLGHNEEVEVQIRPFWHNPTGSNHNQTQSDSVEFDITFHLDQS